MEALPPADEALRLERLRSLRILDTQAEEAFDDLVHLVTALCDVPMAFISLVDAERQWFKARIGVAASETPRAIAFCAHAIRGTGILEIEDARADARFADNPLVTGEPGIRFYAGAPLVAADGCVLGTISAADRRPRRLEAAQRDALRRLSHHVMRQLELRGTVAELEASRAAHARSRRQLETAQRLARIGSWRAELQSGELECSAEMLRLLGWPEGAPPPRLAEWSRLVHADDRGEFGERLRAALAGDAPLDFVHRIVRVDGRERVLHARGEPERDGAGEPTALSGTSQDVTANYRLASEVSTVFDLALDLLCVVDFEGRFRRLSPSWEHTLGYGLEEMNGALFSDFLHPEDLERTQAIWRRALAGESVVGFENRYRAKSGAYRTIVWSSVTVMARGLCFATARDVTDARAAAERLSASEERFRLAARAARDVIWDWDLRNGSVWCNEAFYAHFGHAQDGVSSHEEWSELLHPADRERVAGGLEQVLDAGGDLWQDDYRLRCADGAYAHVRDRAFILRDADGAPVRVVGSMSDVTELHGFAELLNQSSDLILVLDADGCVVHANAAAARSLGRPAAELIGVAAEQLPFFERAQLLLGLRLTEERGSWVGELRATVQGKECVFDARFSRVDRFARKAPVVLVALTDATEKRQLEAQFVRAQRLESIGTLAGGVAHDLNNVLAPILVASEMLELNSAAERDRELARTIRDCARRGADLVRQVLSFARGTDGARVAVRVPALLEEIRRIVAESFPPSIHCIVRAPREPWSFRGDPAQVRQAVLNLCANARDAMEGGGDLVLAAENVELDLQYAAMIPGASPGRYVQIGVTDTGSGIPRHLQGRLFEPFFTTKEVGKGTGLGLSTAHSIVQRHGGFINVYSEPGRGSTFKLYLPADLEQAAAPAARPEEGEIPRGAGEVLLLIDDEAAVRSISQQTLQAFGYEVLLAGDGAEGVAVYAAHRERIALVMTDMMMPIMDGPALIRALQSLDPAVRILAISGLGANGAVAKAAGSGIRHFLSKPYSAEGLLRAIRRALAS